MTVGVALGAEGRSGTEHETQQDLASDGVSNPRLPSDKGSQAWGSSGRVDNSLSSRAKVGAIAWRTLEDLSEGESSTAIGSCIDFSDVVVHRGVQKGGAVIDCPLAKRSRR
jgi:hypothetical protein